MYELHGEGTAVVVESRQRALDNGEEWRPSKPSHD